MALISRVSRLFQADLHAVLDRIEEPDVLLRQAVREMEEGLAGDEQRLKLLTHEHTQLTTRDRDLAHALDNTEEQLNLCFDADKDDLARGLVKRKLETENLRKRLQRRRASIEQTASGLESRLRENRERLENMRQKAELLAQENATEHEEVPWDAADSLISDADVEVAFLREKQRRSRQ